MQCPFCTPSLTWDPASTREAREAHLISTHGLPQEQLWTLDKKVINEIHGIEPSA